RLRDCRLAVVQLVGNRDQAHGRIDHPLGEPAPGPVRRVDAVSRLTLPAPQASPTSPRGERHHATARLPPPFGVLLDDAGDLVAQNAVRAGERAGLVDGEVRATDPAVRHGEPDLAGTRLGGRDLAQGHRVRRLEEHGPHARTIATGTCAYTQHPHGRGTR